MADETERELAGASGGDIGGDVTSGPVENEPGAPEFSGEVESTTEASHGGDDVGPVGESSDDLSAREEEA